MGVSQEDVKVFVDISELTGALIGASVCVVGSGPVGQSVASVCAARGLDTLLVEAGGAGRDRSFRTLTIPDGGSRRGRYSDVSVHRTLDVGGTARQWEINTTDGPAVRMVGLTASDFCDRGISPVPWPFGLDELQPYYAEASALSGIDPDPGSVEHFADDANRPLDFGGAPVTTRVFQLAQRSRFLPPTSAVLADPRIRVISGALVTELVVDRAGQRVRRAVVAHHLGTRQIEADVFVVAMGTIGTTQLLLGSRSSHHPQGIGNHADHLGRHFTDHPIVRAGYFQLDDPATVGELGLYDLGTHGSARPWAKLVLDDAVVVDRGLLNTFTALFPFRAPRLAALRPRWDQIHASGARTGSVAALRGLLMGAERGLGAGAHAHAILDTLRGPDDLFWYTADRLRLALPHHRYRGFNSPGWSREDWRGRVAIDLIQLCEQRPEPDNRMVLTDRVDAFGRPRFRVDWRWSTEDDRSIAEGHDVLAGALDGTGLGRTSIHRDGKRVRMVHPSAHHHAGTTRMSARPEHGVVDPRGAVHGVDNLFVAGASVFPTAGYANPTLTAMALGCRVGHHVLT